MAGCLESDKDFACACVCVCVATFSVVNSLIIQRMQPPTVRGRWREDEGGEDEKEEREEKMREIFQNRTLLWVWHLKPLFLFFSFVSLKVKFGYRFSSGHVRLPQLFFFFFFISLRPNWTLNTSTCLRAGVLHLKWISPSTRACKIYHVFPTSCAQDKYLARKWCRKIFWLCSTWRGGSVPALFPRGCSIQRAIQSSFKGALCLLERNFKTQSFNVYFINEVTRKCLFFFPQPNKTEDYKD